MKRIYLPVLILLVSTEIIHAQTAEPSDSITRELQEIVVTARQPATKLVGTTLVSTIAGSNLQNLGTCLDVLAQLPMISVSDTDVSVVGKGSPEIYIDGRPMRDADELRQLQSTNIRKVELLTAPGAMYGNDTRAVLKITTRRNFINGLSLTERAELTVRRKVSANDLLDLNYRTGKWDLFATATVAHNNSLIKGTTINSLMYEGKKTVVGSSQHNVYPTTNGTVKGGFNFADGAQSFGTYYRFNPERGDFTNTGDEWLNDEPHIRRDINRELHSHSHLVSTYYDNTFGGIYNLHFDGNFRSALSKSALSTSYPDSESSDVNSNDRRNSTLWAGKLYLTFPLRHGSFTVGTQDSYTHTTLDYLMHNPEIGEYIPSSLTDARQTSLAAFASWSRSFGRLDLSAGVRYEYLDYDFTVDGKKDTDVSRTDHLLTPDLSLSWTFNEQSQASLSYRLTTVKPPYSQLTRSLGYVGKHEIEGGNPALRDERMHDIQFFGMLNGFMLQADFTRSIDTYAFVKRLYPADNLQLIMQPINLDVSALDIYFIWSGNIRVWSPNFTIGAHKQWLRLDGTTYDRPIFSYYLENLFTLPYGYQLTLNIHGQSRGDMHTNRFGTTLLSTDASVSKSFLNKSLTVKLSATDIFNTANNDWTMNTYGIFVDKRQSYDRRGISLAVTYRFQPRQSKYKGKNASESEMNRL
ncbi:MAG: TonB-dependent receptor [Duncaniella sp.]|nr:TonB-dependent receptor [Duncaniella sp.]